jgi:hypothetical protein
MKKSKGGMLLLLVLSTPLAAYAAWHVKGVVRTDMVVSDPPADRGGSKDQLAAGKDKAVKWASDARKASTVAVQFRGVEPADIPADAGAAEAVRAAAARAADLNDLDQFLSEVDPPKYAGKLKENYHQWNSAAKQARADGRLVTGWLGQPRIVSTATDAGREMKALEELLNQYLRSTFSSRRQAAIWRIRGRLQVIRELGARADERYPAAVKLALPLKPGNDAIKTALDTFAGVKAQVAALENDVKQAEDEKAELTGALRGEKDDRIALAAKCQGREKLLEMFARETLFTDPTGASAWLRDVAAVYQNSKDDADRDQIRKKVQEFCEAFLPLTVRLDDRVMWKDKLVKRGDLSIEYEQAAGAAKQFDTLSASPEGVTEFNLAEKYPGPQTDVRYNGAPGRPSDLKPTALSKAALDYWTYRKAVGPGATGPKWTVKSVQDLKNKCEPQKELVEKLKLVRKKDDPASDDELRIWTRLESLLDGLKACPADLLE